MGKKGILLINLGTPDSPSVSDVRKYLREFLMDKRVIDLPFIWRWLLINLIIAPFRSPKSAKAYQLLWSPEGSPLLHFGLKLKQGLQQELGSEYIVEFAMRYQNPPLRNALEKLQKLDISSLKIIPLYPQYASSSSGSTIEEVMKIVSSWQRIPNISFVTQFYDHKGFINAFSKKGNAYLKTGKYDHVLFSFHGLPERHIKKGDLNNHCRFDKSCCSSISGHNQLCYRAQCYRTATLITQQLNLNESQYTVAFQSRLETRAKDPWIKPYSDEVIQELARSGIKSLLVYSPSFIADCLETTVEIGIEYEELFIQHGGERLQLVESLNNEVEWIKTLI